MLVKLTKGERVDVVAVLDRKSTISAETDFFFAKCLDSPIGASFAIKMTREA